MLSTGATSLSRRRPVAARVAVRRGAGQLVDAGSIGAGRYRTLWELDHIVANPRPSPSGGGWPRHGGRSGGGAGGRWGPAAGRGGGAPAPLGGATGAASRERRPGQRAGLTGAGGAPIGTQDAVPDRYGVRRT